MGYNIQLTGQLLISPNVKSEHYNYINKFNRTRRMKRDEIATAVREDWRREAVNLPVGKDGCFFVAELGLHGQKENIDVINYNTPPSDQPSLNCHWKINKNKLIWDGSEKFDCHTKWLDYLIKYFFKPWGYKLNGSIEWQGEWLEDTGIIIVKNNVVEEKEKILQLNE